MSFQERAQNPPATVAGLCKVGEYLSGMADEEAIALSRMLASDAWGHTELAHAMTEEGYPIHRDALSRHRRGICRCAATS